MEQQTFTEMQASKLIKQVGSALQYIHSLGIVHRDLKPENLMYCNAHDSNIKVIDFGLSNRIKTMNEATDNPVDIFSLRTPCGTPHYAAPELIRNQAYGAPVDCWSLGIIIYMLLCGFPPFFDTNIKKLFKMIKKGKFGFPSPFWDTISEEAKDLIKKLLVVDARKRFTAKQLLDHEWIKGYYFEREDDVIDDIPLPLSPDIIEEDESDNNNLSYKYQIPIGAPLQPVISNQNSFVYENASIDNNQFSSKRSVNSNDSDSDSSDSNTNITQSSTVKSNIADRLPLSPSDSVVLHQNVFNDKGGVFGTPIMNGI